MRSYPLTKYFQVIPSFKLMCLITNSQRAGEGGGYNSECDHLSNNLMFPNNGESKSTAKLFAVFQSHRSSLSHQLQHTQQNWEPRDLRCKKQLRVAS